MSALVLNLRDVWLSVEDGMAVALAPMPEVAQSTLIVSDFDSALGGVLRFEGNPVHAPALIERRLRGEGTMDGESKILIHHVLKERDGYCVLFTAIPQNSWRRFEEWAHAQKYSCMLVPLFSILWNSLGKSDAVACRNGKQLIFIASLADQIICLNTIAFSEEEQDVKVAMDALADRIQDELGRASKDRATMHAVWLVIFDRANGCNETPELISRFFIKAGLTGEISKTVGFSGSGETIRSGLPRLLNRASFLFSINTFAEKLSWAVQHSFAYCCMMVWALSIFVGIHSATLMWQAKSARDAASHMNAEAVSAQRWSDARAQDIQMPPDYDSLVSVIDGQFTALQRFDVNQIVQSIQASAIASGVRIIRIYTVSTRKNAGADVSDAQLNVDGQFVKGFQGSQARNLGDFVQALRAHGYDAAPVDSAVGQNVESKNGQIFTYRLSRFNHLTNFSK